MTKSLEELAKEIKKDLQKQTNLSVFPKLTKPVSEDDLKTINSPEGCYEKIKKLWERAELLIFPAYFANYKVLCESLGESPKSGKSKELQLGRFAQVFDLHKGEGKSYYINGVKEREKCLVAMAAASLRSYLLCEAFIGEIEKGNYKEIPAPKNDPSGRTFVTIPIKKDTMLLNTGVVSKKFIEKKYKIKLETYGVKEFFREVQSYSLSYSVKAALGSLAKSKVIIVNTGYEITIKGEKRLSTEWETARINDIYVEAFAKTGCKNLAEVYFFNKQDSYFNYAGKDLQKMGITFCREIYLITTGETTLRNFQKLSLPKLEELPFLYLESNTRHVESLSRYFVSVYNRFLRYEGERVLIEGGSLKTRKYKNLPKDYLEQREKLLAEYVIL